MANLNGHATRNGGYSQEDSQGNLSLLGSTIAQESQKNVINHYCCEIPYFQKTIKYRSVGRINCSWH